MRAPAAARFRFCRLAAIVFRRYGYEATEGEAMAHSTTRYYGLVFAAACGLALLAAPAAHAFTVDNQDSSGASNMFLNGTAPSADPDDKLTSGLSNGQSTYKSGNSTFQFGAQPSFEQRYDSNRMFKQYDSGNGN
jgi:hypothetical protein